MAHKLRQAIRNGQLDEIRGAAQQVSWGSQLSRPRLNIIAALVDRNDDEITRIVFTEAKVNLQTKNSAGRTLLHEAAANGNLAVVHYLLSQGLDVSAICNRGSTPLHVTTDCDIAKLLIQHGADINQVDGRNETILRITLRKAGYIQCKRRKVGWETDLALCALINFILQQSPDSSDRLVLKTAIKSYIGSEQLAEIIESLLERGFTLSDDDIRDPSILGAAIDKKLPKFMKWLLDRGANPYGRLESAIWSKNEEILMLLIDHGADVRGNSHLIHRAFKMEWFRGVEILLDHGADVNVKDTDGYSCLHRPHSIDIVKMLVSRGADIHSEVNNGSTPLHFAETIEVAEFYISRGADINAMISDFGTTLVINYLNPGMASFLISKGAHFDSPRGQIAHQLASKLDLALGLGVDIDSEVYEGDNLLHLACQATDVETVWKLLKSGANVNCGNLVGRPPLSMVVDQDMFCMCYQLKDATYKLIDLLLEYGADLNHMSSRYGWSPTYHLVRYGFQSELDWFLARGADLNTTTADGDIILRLTTWYQDADIGKILLMSGADINLKTVDGLTPIQEAKRAVLHKREHSFRRTSLEDFKDYIDLFSQHIIKSKSLGLYVCDENMEAVEGEMYTYYDRECRQELDLLRRIKLTGDVCPVDILRDKHPECVFNETDSKTISSLDLKRFPQYGEWIQTKYRIAKERFDRMEASRRFLGQLIHETGTSKGLEVTCFPIELINKILAYLSVPHLRKLGEELMILANDSL